MGMIRTIDDHENVEKILTVTFAVDRAVNHLSTGCASLGELPYVVPDNFRRKNWFQVSLQSQWVNAFEVLTP